MEASVALGSRALNPLTVSVRTLGGPPGLGWNKQQQPRSHKPPVAGLIPLPDSGTPCGVPV